MSPAARATVNRANAQKSTGPKSAAGKKRSSLNAFRHGLTGQTVVMPEEDMAAYTDYCKRAFADLKPAGFLEEQAVQTIADTNWRLNRGRAYESTLFSLAFAAQSENIITENAQAHCALAQAEAAPDLTKSLANLSTYEQRLNRTLTQAKKELAELQARRQEEERKALEAAITLRKYHKITKIPWQPSDDGFVLTLAQVDAALRAQDRRTIAGWYVSDYAPSL